MRPSRPKRLALVVAVIQITLSILTQKIAQEITMSTLELKASDAVASANPSNLKSHDFAIMWSYAIAVLAVLLVVSYGTTATQVGSSVDFASLSIPL